MPERVPAALRRGDGHGGIDLTQRHVGADRELRGGQGRLIHAFGDVVALAAGIGIARGGEAEPLVGLHEILLDADAAGIEHRQIVLAVGEAIVRGLAEPFGGRLVIGALATAIGEQHGEIVHRLRVAAFGGGDVAALGGADILRHAEALLIEAAEAEHRRHQALLGGAVVPLGGFGVVLGNELAIGVAAGDFVGGGWRRRSALLRAASGRRWSRADASAVSAVVRAAGAADATAFSGQRPDAAWSRIR